MDSNKSYLTQLNKQDLKEIADVANIHAGEGIDIVRGNDGIEVSIDRQYLKMCINAYISGNEF